MLTREMLSGVARARKSASDEERGPERRVTGSNATSAGAPTDAGGPQLGRRVVRWPGALVEGDHARRRQLA